MIEAELDPDDFPTFDVKYRNFKTELDDNDTPYVSYDLECSLVLDYILYTSQSNAADVYRDRAYLSLSMRHIPVLIGCMP
ncbi:MAG: hypothetical protein MJ219_01310 [Mycoplasmoidaceae bacterium]|nr:hypothetical protein [Mycoplasmoidaceae bacterium]